MGTNEIPATVAAAIKKCWPDSVIEEFDADESYFQSIRQSVERDLRSIPGAALLYQTEEREYTSTWDDDWEDDPQPDPEAWCSYCVFFLAPKGSEFQFTDETESFGYDEETGEEEPGETCPGEGWIGCVVGISLAARFAAISVDTYSQFEDGSRHCPDIEPSIFSVETSRPIDPVEHYRQKLGEATFAMLEQLRRRIAAILKKHRIRVLEPAILDLPTPTLAADEEVFLQPPIRVRDALFFRGV